MKNIASENPQDHWSMLDVKDKVTLDLGCGRMWGIRPTTPEFFLNNGAKSVLGVEMWDNERIWYLENVPDHKLTVVTDEIKTPEQLSAYFKSVRPQAVKCDIEGYESLLNQIDVSDFDSIGEMAIEYHSKEMKEMIDTNYERWGFKDIEHYYMSNFDPNEQGVIHIKK